MILTPVLGIIALETPPDLFPGSLHHQNTFKCDVISQFAKGVAAVDMINARSHVEDRILEAAAALVGQGATHITSNCGYTVLYTDTLRDVIDVPVFVSNLQLLPTLVGCRAHGGKIGILTYDANKLTDRHLSAAVGGHYQPEFFAVRGMEKTASWADWATTNPVYDFETARRDILGAMHKVLEEDLSCILLECEVMSPFADIIAKAAGVPVYDLVSSLRFLFGLR